MKCLRYARFFVAALAAAFLSSCGGGDNSANSDTFVSVEQFQSGSSGFFVMGVGGSFRIISNGTAGNEDIVNNEDAFAGEDMLGPYDVFERQDDDQSNPWVTPSGWEDLGKIERMSKIVSGSLIAGGTVVAAIDSMLYSIEAGGNRAHLEVQFSQQNSNSLFESSLAYFFGNITPQSVSSSNLGNVGSVWINNSTRRILLPTADGCSMHIWFDFSSGRSLVQLVTGIVIAEDYRWEDENGTTHNENNPPQIGSAATAQNATFRRIVN